VATTTISALDQYCFFVFLTSGFRVCDAAFDPPCSYPSSLALPSALFIVSAGGYSCGTSERAGCESRGASGGSEHPTRLDLEKGVAGGGGVSGFQRFRCTGLRLHEEFVVVVPSSEVWGLVCWYKRWLPPLHEKITAFDMHMPARIEYYQCAELDLFIVLLNSTDARRFSRFLFGCVLTGPARLP